MVFFICAGAGVLVGIWMFFSASEGDHAKVKITWAHAFLLGIGIPVSFMTLGVIFTCWGCKKARSLKIRRLLQAKPELDLSEDV